MRLNIVVVFLLTSICFGKDTIECSDVEKIVTSYKPFFEINNIAFLSSKSKISFYKENVTTDNKERYTTTPVVFTSDGRKKLLKLLWWEENPTVVDTVFTIDLNHNGKNDLIIIYKCEGYLQEFSSAGTVREVYAFADYETSLPIDSSGCLLQKYPFINEYFSIIRTATENGKDSCAEKFCTTDAIVKEIHRLGNLPTLQFIKRAYSLALNSYKSKMTDNAAAISTIGIVYLSFLSDSTVAMFNDFGYFLEQGNAYNQSLQILKPVTDQFPDRAVAFLNLGDAYFGVHDYSNAKEAYVRYIDVMKKAGKEKKIPGVVFERIK